MKIVNPESIGDPDTTPVVYVGEEVGEVLGIRQRDEPVLTVAWLVQALGIVRQVSEFNEGYNPSTLAALHWGEKAVQRIADLEAEVAALRAALPTPGGQPMSELDLDAIRARCEAATPGPWFAYNANEGTEYLPAWEVANDAYHNPPADEDAPWIAVHLETGVRDDAEFVAAARSDVPDLLAALASSRAEVERLTQQRDDAIQTLNNVRESLELVGTNFDKADAERERMRPVVEAAKTWRWRSATHPTTPYLDATRLEAAVDTYESQEGTDGA